MNIQSLNFKHYTCCRFKFVSDRCLMAAPLSSTTSLPRLQKLTFEFSRRFGDTFEFSLGQIWASGIGHRPCLAYGGDPHTTTVAQFNISTFFTLNIVCFVFIVNLNLTNIFMSIYVFFFKGPSRVCEIYGQKSIEVNWDINLGVLPPPGPITSPIFQTGDISN